MRLRMALLVAIFATLTVFWRTDHRTVAGEKPSDDFAALTPFLAKHCLNCHGPEKKKADLAFHIYKDELSLVKDRKVWSNVLQMIQSGEMPPQGRPRPGLPEVEAFTKAVQNIFVRADKKAGKDPGRVTMRRLNRAEYNNTIRDLVGVDFDATEFLPQDDSGYGFDNIGDVLSLSPYLMERYLAASENIMQRAILVETPKPSVRHMNGKYLEPATNPANIKFARPLYTRTRLHTPYKITLDGEFKFRVKCSAEQLGDEPVRIVLDMDGKELRTITIKDTKSQVHEATVELDVGDHRGGVTLLNEFAEKDKKRGIHVEWLELVGPTDARPASQRKLLALPDGMDKKDAIPLILERFASRAFRRPATKDEVARLVKLVDKAQTQGENWEGALQIAMQAVLCSPKFLFRVELDHHPDSAQPHPLDDYQLASRLSYFLWTSLPDEELTELAAKKQLHQNIEAQVKRMLQKKTAKPGALFAHALVENFGLQWLHLRNLKAFAPDPKNFPEWDEPLRKSMMQETELFLRAILEEDRSILDMIDANFTFLNERLGRHYGILDTLGNRVGEKKKIGGGAILKGPAFQRVTLQGDERGGLLTQASILAVTSNPTRTSPVKRGRWVLEQILGTPPPPPPPDVPELAEGEKAELKGTLRQRMEQHRANPSCASCHARMDPIGFAFENFNAIGKFRAKDGDNPIDPSGTLPGGQVFKGPNELKAILKGKKDLFARCLTEKMLTYALGRGLEYYDKGAVDNIVAALENNDYKISTLLVEVAKSDPFRLRRGKDQK